eukprot:205978-Rhodomonas_salina.1
MREAAAGGGEALALPPETVTILDDEAEAGAAADHEGQEAQDDDVTESDGGEKKVTSSSETDAGLSQPLSETVANEITDFLSKESGKKRRHVWMDAEKCMVMDLYHYCKDSLRGTISYLQRSSVFAGSSLRKIDRKMLKRWVAQYKKLKPGEELRARGRARVEEFEIGKNK